MDQRAQWQERTVQQLVRYEALFRLLDEIQQTEEIEEIANRVVKHWKYFANVVCWRLVLPGDGDFLIIDGFRGEARLMEVAALQPWDARHLSDRIPRLLRPRELSDYPSPPEHLTGTSVSEIQVLPFVRTGDCIGLLTAATRHEPFDDLDIKFTRIFGSHFSDRVSNIRLRRQAMTALADKANRDALTGLLNRGAIIEQLGHSLTRSRARGDSLSVILADIDFFKVINDSHGHLAGDLVLREVARRFRANTFASDNVGRYGGEEFLFVLSPCNAREALMAAERLRRLVAETCIRIGSDPIHDIHVTLSLGTASIEGQASTRIEELLKRADCALYRSKRSGRNKVTHG